VGTLAEDPEEDMEGNASQTIYNYCVVVVVLVVVK
jgi:hypothetical protein